MPSCASVCVFVLVLSRGGDPVFTHLRWNPALQPPPAGGSGPVLKLLLRPADLPGPHVPGWGLHTPTATGAPVNMIPEYVVIFFLFDFSILQTIEKWWDSDCFSLCFFPTCIFLCTSLFVTAVNWEMNLKCEICAVSAAVNLCNSCKILCSTITMHYLYK